MKKQHKYTVSELFKIYKGINILINNGHTLKCSIAIMASKLNGFSGNIICICPKKKRVPDNPSGKITDEATISRIHQIFYTLDWGNYSQSTWGFLASLEKYFNEYGTLTVSQMESLEECLK